MYIQLHGQYPYKFRIFFHIKGFTKHKNIWKPVFYNSRHLRTNGSPERSREVEEQTPSTHVRVHQIPKVLVTTVPFANWSDRFHQSAVHIPVT